MKKEKMKRCRPLPNFNIGRHIQEWLDMDCEDALIVIRDYYEAHPRKFRSTLTWAVGGPSDEFKRVMDVVKGDQ